MEEDVQRLVRGPLICWLRFKHGQVSWKKLRQRHQSSVSSSRPSAAQAAHRRRADPHPGAARLRPEPGRPHQLAGLPAAALARVGRPGPAPAHPRGGHRAGRPRPRRRRRRGRRQLAPETPSAAAGRRHRPVPLADAARWTAGEPRSHEGGDEAAAEATAEAPLAHLRFEAAEAVETPVADARQLVHVRLTMWPGGGEQWLATADVNGRNVRWLQGSRA